MATACGNGWPYAQFRGGETRFLRVIDDTTIDYADFRGAQSWTARRYLLI